MKHKPRILVAEDEVIIAMDLKHTLEEWGFNVEKTFRKGEDLLRYAQADDPEILIMDIFLAGEMDGITAAKEVLKSNNIPVIFMTGHMGQKYSSKINIGCKHSYITKPFSKEELKQSLYKVYPKFKFD